MDNSRTANELLEYYVNLLIIQYRDKPKARAALQAFLDVLMIYDLMVMVRDGYDLDTATGRQLDVIGKYLGLSRNTVLNLVEGKYFGYSPYGGTAPWEFAGYLEYLQEAAMLTLTVDNPVFWIGEDGQPYPGQVAHLQALKQNIAQQVHWDVVNRVIPDGTERIEVTPWDMGYGRIELKNRVTDDNENWKSNTTTGQSYGYTSYVVDDLNVTTDIKLFSRVDIKIDKLTGADVVPNYARLWTNIDPYVSSASFPLTPEFRPLSVGQEVSLYGVSTVTAGHRIYGYVPHTYSNKAADTNTTSTRRPEQYILPQSLIDALARRGITTDTQIAEWCNQYIPYIPAGESWTIGGKLKNLWDVAKYPNVKIDRFSNGPDTLVQSGNGVHYISENTYEGPRKNAPFIYCTLINVGLTENEILNDWFYSRATVRNNLNEDRGIYANSNGGTGLSASIQTVPKGGEGTISMLITKYTNPSYQFQIRADSIDLVTGTLHTDCFVYDTIEADLTTSGWLARLSLMGIESKEDVYSFMQSIPFFKDELDFPITDPLPVTVTAGEYSDSKTLFTVNTSTAPAISPTANALLNSIMQTYDLKAGEWSDAIWMTYDRSQRPYTALTDDEYRTLLKFRIIQLSGNASAASLDRLLQEQFGGQARMIDNLDMSIEYIFPVSMRRTVRIAQREGLLPHPAGVNTTVSFVNPQGKRMVS